MSLSVHLVGSTYGAVQDCPNDKSIVVLQNELAMKRSREAGLRRIWYVGDANARRSSAGLARSDEKVPP